MLVDKQNELMSDLLFAVHQHGSDDVTWKVLFDRSSRHRRLRGFQSSLVPRPHEFGEFWNRIYLYAHIFTQTHVDCALNHSGSGFKRCGFGNRFYWFGVNESRFVFKFISFQKYPGKVERNWMSYHDPRAARRQFCVSKLKAITSSWPLKRELHMNPKTKNNFFTRIGLLFTRNQWIRSPKPHLFETAL